jgi:hypothetical protein
MQEIVTKVYKYDELGDKAKEKARDWYRSVNVYEWWESIYADAKTVGVQITAFDCQRYAHGHFLESAQETAHKIAKEHGETTPTYKTAKEYLKQRDEIIDTAPKTEDGDFKDEYALDQALDELDREFLRSLLEDYRVTLDQEWDYINSDEQVEEGIIANGYEFTEHGKVV